MRLLKFCFACALLVCGFANVVAGQTIRCSSDDGGRHYCQADTRNGVMMTKQISGAACQQGYSWDSDEHGIWVDHGCRAEFTLQSAAYATSGPAIYCASNDGGRHTCKMDTRNGVVLVKQKSGAACQQGYSWGVEERGIWVDHGCRADFAPQAPAQYGGGASTVVRCSSDDGGKHYCDADTSGDVELLRQRSHADCTEGYSWGFDARGIWVDHGCRGDFAVQPHERPGNSSEGGQPVYCPSDDGHRHYCDVDTGGGVQLVKQRSASSCQQGYSWGYDEHGIWVDHGCRADFVVSRRGGHREGHGERACYRSVGEQRANELVQQCLQVSPGTHPPCNAQNSCKMITDEIRRSCELLGNGAPSFCDEYR